MIDVLNNVDKIFVAIKPINTWIYPISQLPEGTLLKLDSVELGSFHSKIHFKVSKDNDLDSMSLDIMNKRVELKEKELKRKKELYELVLNYWNDSPDIFTLQNNGYSTKTYKCSKVIADKDYTPHLSTGYGSNTYYDKEYYEQALASWDKLHKEELKSIAKNPKTHTKDLLKAAIEISSAQLDKFIKLQEEGEKTSTKKKEKVKKPPFPFKFDADFLNFLLSETGGDFEVDDELIEDFAETDEQREQLEKIKGSVFSAETEGYHNHDGQVCDYLVTILTPDNHEYTTGNSHCLVTGWNFDGLVEFY